MLALYHTIQTCNDLGKKYFDKILGKRETRNNKQNMVQTMKVVCKTEEYIVGKYWLPAFSHFPTMF